MAFIGGQVYAKYMSRVSGTGKAEIANWSFKVNDKEENMQTISLNSTINNGKIAGNKIAPGTQGSFNIKLDASEAEVGINYVINFYNKTSKPQNLKFTYNGTEYDSLVELGKTLSGTINLNDESKIRNLSIGWIWEFETGDTDAEKRRNDEIDTADAKELDDYQFDVIVTGRQINPEA